MTNLGDQVLSAYDSVINLFPQNEIKEIINKSIAILLFNLYKSETKLTKKHLIFVNQFSEEPFSSTFELEMSLSEVSEDFLKMGLDKTIDTFDFFQKYDLDSLKSGKELEATVGYCLKQLLYFLGMYALSINGTNKDELNKDGFDLLNSYIEYIDKWIKEKYVIAETEDQTSEQITKDEESLPSLEELLLEFNSLIGLTTLKEDINDLINLIRVRKMRIEQNLPVPPVSLHLVFTGNPGTGKTTVARKLAKIYQKLGVVSKGHLVEVDRSELVAGYIGQTAIKVQGVVEKSLGGILFIDEAYSLASSNSDSDYGKEAIETLLKCMEDYRNDLVVIVAGYPDEMEKFLHSNPGLKSRFNKFIEFPDYDAESLFQIFEKMCKDAGYILAEDAKGYASSLFQFIVSKKTKNFGNGRVVRNIFEKMISNQANRVVNKSNPNTHDLSLIVMSDLKQVELY